LHPPLARFVSFVGSLLMPLARLVSFVGS